MTKETLIPSPIEIQRKLWGKICGQDGLAKRVEQARRGHLPNGLTLAELSGNIDGFTSLLGDFAPRVLIASNPNNARTLVPEQIALAGGWCALRTKDIISLSEQGVIMDPRTGELQPVRSVWQVADWIKQSTAFDQVIESVGATRGSEYVVISERRLWTERIIGKLSDLFNRALTPAEGNTIERAIEEAESMRAEMTVRYLTFVTGNEFLVFRRVVDADIWDELERAKTEMLGRVGLSVPLLSRMFPKERPIIQSSAIVWTMYSEPYFDVLRKNGLMSKKIAFIVEPSLHTYADSLSGNEVVQRIYQDRGIYLDPRGINPNTGFIAFIECVTETGVNVRKNIGVGLVPNIANWENLLTSGMLSPDKNLVIEPKGNKLFIWGSNLLPFGSTRQSLLRLMSLQEEFAQEKQRVNATVSNSLRRNPEVKESLKRRVEELRKEFLIRVAEQNQRIAANLKNLFTYLTAGVTNV